VKLSRKETSELIKSMEGRILITTHKNPDGDAIGSSLGWFNFLKSMGKDVELILYDRVPYYFDFLPGAKEVKQARKIEANYNWAILTDVSSLKRTGFEEIPADRTLVIDHHITAEPFTDFSLVEPEISSACELSYEVMLLTDPSRISKEVALPIYTGIVTDTGSFRHSNTSARTHKVAAELIEKGVDPAEVAMNLFERNRLSRFKLLKLVLETLEFAVDGRVACVTITREFLERAGAIPEEAEGFVSYPRSIAGVEVAVAFRELEEGGWKVSLRSKGSVNVAVVAKAFGGGGHPTAAGYEVAGNLKAVKESLVAVLRQAIR
jgi:phosphoesterase RecJ-like protein